MCVGGGGGGGSGNITCGFQGGGVNVFTFSLEGGGGVRQNLGTEPRSQPPPPRHLNNERSLTSPLLHHTTQSPFSPDATVTRAA